MKEAIKQQEKRYGIVGKTFEMPLQVKSDEEILQLYKDQYTENSKVVLVSLVVYMTGRVMPVKKIADWAHSKGLEVIVDAAHAVSHVNFRVDSIGADYLGTSLHKWVAAPLGLGFLYVKKEHVKKIWPLLGDVEKEEDDVEKLEHLGTIPMGTHLALLNAIRFQEFLQPARKEARLKLLRNHWLRQVKDLPGIRINTPLEEESGCAIGNVHLEKYKNDELQKKLLDNYGIFTVALGEPAYGVRITPNVFNSLAEIDLLVEALRELAEA
jgi:selenocysteine lyase/cysteine desulfurase